MKPQHVCTKGAVRTFFLVPYGFPRCFTFVHVVLEGNTIFQTPIEILQVFQGLT